MPTYDSVITTSVPTQSTMIDTNQQIPFAYSGNGKLQTGPVPIPTLGQHIQTSPEQTPTALYHANRIACCLLKDGYDISTLQQLAQLLTTHSSQYVLKLIVETNKDIPTVSFSLSATSSYTTETSYTAEPEPVCKIIVHIGHSGNNKDNRQYDTYCSIVRAYSIELIYGCY